MGLGSTAKKIQKVADVAEQLYTKVNELKEQVDNLRETVDDTNERVDGIEQELTEQRALLEAVAEEQGLDPEVVASDAGIADAVPADEDD